MTLSTVGRLAGLPRRRPALHPLRQDRGHRASASTWSLADGRTIHTGGHPRQAVGPDLNQLFVGSEGTLGVITGARLRACTRPPPTSAAAAYGFASFAAGLDACRRILRRGATPAVLRLYDAIESDRSYAAGDRPHVLLVLDEGDPAVVDGDDGSVVDEECAGPPTALDDALVEHWLGAPQRRGRPRGADLAGPTWSTPWRSPGRGRRSPAIYAAALDAIAAVPGTLAVSAHQSHSYPDGACLYFTFAGKPEPDGQATRYYRGVWDAGTRAVLAARRLAAATTTASGSTGPASWPRRSGGGLDVLVAVKAALDPNGILNPGKLGLGSPWGTPTVP